MADSQGWGSENEVDFAILGSGPCGLGAAWRLKNRKGGPSASFVVIDRNPTPGGSASSVTTAEGFTFDYGGHVLYPHKHYSVFAPLLDDLVPDWHESTPIRGVWMDGHLIPYPLQRNLHRLLASKLLIALGGLIKIRIRDFLRPGNEPPADDLQSYLDHTFGAGLTAIALGPLNKKMWAHDPNRLSSDWTAQRSGSNTPNITRSRVRELLRSIITRRDNPGWDDSTKVRYPAQGGTGSIWAALAMRFTDHVINSAEIVAVDASARLISLANGRQIHYRHLLSTLPLDVLVNLLRDKENEEIELAKHLRYAQAGFVGFGFSGSPPEHLRGVHSFHIPQPDVPCWRITLPSHFSPGNAPPGAYWSMLCEISAAPETDLDPAKSADRILEQLRKLQIVPEASRVVSRWTTLFRHGYPVPFAGRDAVLQRINKSLRRRGILSRGRFGGWKYEVSNQDHTFMQGVEAIDFLLDQKTETTYRLPELIN